MCVVDKKTKMYVKYDDFEPKNIVFGLFISRYGG